MNLHRTMIVPASIVATVRALADRFGPGASSMFTTGLSPTGAEPATHFISTGVIDSKYAAIMPYSDYVDGVWTVAPYNHTAFVALAQGKGVTPPPLQAIQQIMSIVDVSEQEPFAAMQRLGLVMIATPL